MAAPPAAAAPAAPPVLPPTAFLMALKNNVNVSAACVAGVNELLQNSTRAKMADFFSGRVSEGLGLLLPTVLQDLAFTPDKRAGLGHFEHQIPLWSLGVPDSCGYLGLNYCTVDTVPVLAKWGVCVPAVCTIQDVMTGIFPPVTKKLAERIKGRCGPLHPERTLFVTREPWPPGAIVTLTLLALLLLAVLVSTAIDVYGKDSGIPLLEDDGSLVVRVARCFSLRQNYDRLMAPPRAGPFLCLDAVRVLSMMMILLGHTLFYEQTQAGVTNPREAMGFYNRGFMSTGVGLIANSTLYGVDTFLALAGFLAVYLFMKELGKRLPRAQGRAERASLVTQMALGSYIRRYLRLTPAYAVVLAVFTTLAPFLSSAPASPTDLITQTGLCERKWWQNLLFVNNLLSTSYSMCYLPSWFLCVIQQLFLLVPWLAIVALKRPNAALFLCALACIASYVYSFETAQKEGWRLNGLDRPGFPNFFTHFYIKPFTRMPTFLIGCAGAVLWHHHSDRFLRFMSSGRAALKTWGLVAVGLAILAAAEFAPHDEMAYAPGLWSQTRASVFIALCWSAWVAGLACLCAVVFAGRGGPLKWLLELPMWSPLARLVYSTYLVHPMVIQIVIAARGGTPAHFSLVFLFYQFIGYSALAGLTSFLFYFWVEAPFGELERLLFHRPATGGKGNGKVVEELETEKPVHASVVVVPVLPSEAGDVGSRGDLEGVAQ